MVISTIGKTTPTEGATFSAVPPDIIQTHILTYLDGSSLASAASTCSQLNTLSSHDHLWTNICHSTWPSTNTPRIRQVISTFSNTSRSFFSDSFSTVTAKTFHHHRRVNINTTPEFLSAVDLFHRRRMILSRVVETETVSGWFRYSPFRVDILDPKDSVETDMEYLKTEEECKNLEEELSLSWIVIDPSGKRAVNVSSRKPVSVNRHWLTGDIQVRFATVLHGGEKGSATEATVCSLLVTLGREMQVREACFQIEDMDGNQLNGGDSLGILQRALEGERKRLRSEKEGKERYVEFVKRKVERKERKLRSERRLDMLCVSLAALSVAAFSTLFLS
ncbi:putative F-box domain-containing protein [Medicago truncatula]|uniref:F-box plant protein, putative n=1 Tax=Medicago truncatula TaxID=3880 RepID=A0A072U364_MEDTR|nr:probable F-box protein At2g36090 [Medicago truncatula]KEH24159.1 F-box plant protein, putative [Medicago truncatula]RHN48720.1 putative F-box domain-containing protein [Medicago truncatula]